jgi:hypothetical protein
MHGNGRRSQTQKWAQMVLKGRLTKLDLTSHYAPSLAFGFSECSPFVCVFLAAILLGDAFINGKKKAQLTRSKAAVCLALYFAIIFWQGYRTFQTNGEHSEKPKASDGA